MSSIEDKFFPGKLAQTANWVMPKYSSQEDGFKEPKNLSDPLMESAANLGLCAFGNLHNWEMATSHGGQRKLATVVLITVGVLTVSGLSLIEAIVRCAIGSIAAIVGKKDFSEKMFNAVPIDLEVAINGLEMIYKFFTHRGDVLPRAMGAEERDSKKKKI